MAGRHQVEITGTGIFRDGLHAGIAELLVLFGREFHTAFFQHFLV